MDEVKTLAERELLSYNRLPKIPPPAVSLPRRPGHHAVQFYSDSARLCASVADFLGDGLAGGQPVIVIATPGHRELILRELKRRRFLRIA